MHENEMRMLLVHVLFLVRVQQGINEYEIRSNM